MDFWTYALAQRRRLTVWGDYLHQIETGDLTRPPEVSHWHDVVVICDRARIDVDREEVRRAWYGYTQYRKKHEA